MSPLLAALLPVFGVIALGWGLRRSGLVKADAWPGISRLTYVGLSPALLFSVISRADLASITVGPAILAAAAGFLGMGALILLLRPLIPASGPSFTSIFQAGARWVPIYCAYAISRSLIRTNACRLMPQKTSSLPSV